MRHLFLLLTLTGSALAAPPKATHHDPNALWAETTGLNAEVISHGESVDIPSALVSDRYTVVHFGAPWCGPCHVAEARLREYLPRHLDTVVRAVVLDSRDPSISLSMPAAREQLAHANGLPHLEVYAPSGERLYDGWNIRAALHSVDVARAGS